MWQLTDELRGRPEAPDQSRGCTLSSRARGDTTERHGPLQRLLDGKAEARSLESPPPPPFPPGWPPPPHLEACDAQPKAVTVPYSGESTGYPTDETACEKVAMTLDIEPQSHDEPNEASEKEAADQAYHLLGPIWWFHGLICRLTDELRGRAGAQAAHRSNEALRTDRERPDKRRGRILSSSARGACP